MRGWGGVLGRRWSVFCCSAISQPLLGGPKSKLNFCQSTMDIRLFYSLDISCKCILRLILGSYIMASSTLSSSHQTASNGELKLDSTKPILYSHYGPLQEQFCCTRSCGHICSSLPIGWAWNSMFCYHFLCNIASCLTFLHLDLEVQEQRKGPEL